MKIKYQHYRTRKQDAAMLPARGQPPSDRLYPYAKDQHDFMPHERGGMTTCRVELEDGTEVVAMATCSMSDPFCYARGRRIALGRAMKDME